MHRGPFPAELLDKIVWCALILSKSKHHPLKSISGLSVACKRSRAIVLRRWFLVRSAIKIQTEEDFFMLSPLATWIREIVLTDEGLHLCKDRLILLTGLRNASFDFGNHTPFDFRRVYTQVLDQFPATLTSLTLTSIPIINKSLLEHIADNFACLKNLHLCTTERLECDEYCCACCIDHNDRYRLLSVQHSPIPDAFPDNQVLANIFGAALSPLTSLMTLYLGIYLSPENLLTVHSQHDGDNDVFAAEITSNPLARCSDCADCCEKHAIPTRRDEEAASLAIARRLSSLKTITWSSCFVLIRDCAQEDEADEWFMWGETKLTVKRSGTNIEVQRVPTTKHGMAWNCF